MAGKKALGTLQPVTKETAPIEVESARRGKSTVKAGHVQTVRMDRETWKALQLAGIDRDLSQNAIMLAAIRRDLGLS